MAKKAKQPSYRVRRALSKFVHKTNVRGRTNPAKKVTLKNFSGTITKNPNGTVSIKGRKK